MTDLLGVLHLTTFLQGGAGRAICDLACAQHAAGHQVAVVTSRTGNADFANYPDYLARLRAAGVALLELDSLFVRDRALHAEVADRIAGAINVRALDIVHAHAAVPAFIGRLVAARGTRPARVIQTQHGWGGNKTPVQAAFDLEMLRSVDSVVATSRATRDQLVQLGAPAERMTVIPCGLPAADAGDPPPAAVAALSALRARGARLAGCIGTVNANKNQRLLVEALPALRDRGVAAVFLGEGSEALREVAAELGVADRVVCCGYQPDASRWLPLLDVLVVPSRTEGQGLAPLEAFRAGVPVVAADIPPLAELIADGRQGLLFAPDDVADLAGVLTRLFELQPAARTAMLERARRRFDAAYTVEKMVARYEAVYRAIACPVR